MNTPAGTVAATSKRISPGPVSGSCLTSLNTFGSFPNFTLILFSHSIHLSNSSAVSLAAFLITSPFLTLPLTLTWNLKKAFLPGFNSPKFTPSVTQALVISLLKSPRV